MKGEVHSYHMRYGSMFYYKRLQSYSTGLCCILLTSTNIPLHFGLSLWNPLEQISSPYAIWKRDIHSFHLRYKSLICPKRLQRKFNFGPLYVWPLVFASQIVKYMVSWFSLLIGSTFGKDKHGTNNQVTNWFPGTKVDSNLIFPESHLMMVDARGPKFISLSPADYPLPACLNGTKKVFNIGSKGRHRHNPALFPSKGK